jgi:cytochrome c553
MNQSAPTTWVFLVPVLGVVGLAARAGEVSDNNSVIAQTMVTDVCEACHGKYGNSTDPSVPSLAGQGRAYLQSQLAAFQAQRRVGVMSGVAMSLNDTDIRDAATYFSQQSPQTARIRATDSRALERGEAIYDKGIAETKVPACASCHALDGAGLPAEFPRLAGQDSRYIAEQLHAFRSESRLGTNTMMRKVSAKLSDDDITAVADYIEDLR